MVTSKWTETSKKRIENEALPRARHGCGPLRVSASATDRIVWPPARTASWAAMSITKASGLTCTSASKDRKPATSNGPDVTERSARAPNWTVLEVSAR